MRTPLHLIQYIHSTLVQLLEVITTKGAFTIILRIINSANFAKGKQFFRTNAFISAHAIMWRMGDEHTEYVRIRP